MERLLPLDDGWIDLDRGMVERQETIRLTDREVQLLAYLAARAGEPCDTDDLLQEVWGYSAKVQSRAVTVALSRLRKKLEIDPRKPRHLVTTYGKGVAFVPAEPDPEGPEARFVGRDEDLARVLAALEDGPVQVTGPGGMGKTRLAREILRQRDGVFCPLANCHDPADVRRTLAWTLAVDPELPDLPTILAATIRTRGQLILDNGEQVDDLQEVLRELDAEGIHYLLTTRHRLDGSAQEIRLAPLDADAGAQLLSDLASVPTEGLDEVVEVLGGLPLALRLVHHHLSWLSPAELARRAADLVGDDGTDTSLRIVLQGSLERLSPGALQGLRRLVARPHVPWPLEVAEAVVGLDALRELADTSLLEPRNEGGAVEMHRLIHRHVPTTEEATRESEERLAAWFDDWYGQKIVEESYGEPVKTLLAVAPLLEGMEPTPVVRLGLAVTSYELGQPREAARRCDEALAFVTEPGPVRWRLQLLRCRAHRRAGLRVEAAALALETSLQQEPWRPNYASDAWQAIAASYMSLREIARARDAYDRALEGSEYRSTSERANLLLERSHAAAAQDHLDEAYAMASEAWLELQQAADIYKVHNLTTLGGIAMRQGRFGVARGWMQAALELSGPDSPRAAVVNGNLAALAVAASDPDAAMHHADQALQGHQRHGRRRGIALARQIRGRAFLLMERWTDAITELESARMVARSIGMSEHARWTSSFLAMALALEGSVDEAQRELPDDDDPLAELARAFVGRARGEDAAPPEVLPAELQVHADALVARG